MTSLTLSSDKQIRLRVPTARPSILTLTPIVVEPAPPGPIPDPPVGLQHDQPSAAIQWTINHNFGRTPIVQVFSIGGLEVTAEIQNPTPNQTIVRFATPYAGYARLI